jgi:hypothetical protein
VTAWLDVVLGTAVGLVSSTVFVLVLFIGFCVLVGLFKLRTTRGHGRVVKNLDEVLTREPVRYYSPSDPRGIADQLRTPELLEAAERKS